MSKRIFIFIFLFQSFLGSTTAYYVTTSGNNSNNGLSVATAFATIQKAADVSRRGDSVYVYPGVYAGFDYRNISGQLRDSVVFYAPQPGAIIQSSGPIRGDGINLEGVSGNELRQIEINGFEIQNLGFAGNGIRLVFADHCIVRNCRSSANGRGIFTGFTDNLLLEYNICESSVDEHGIYLSNSSDDAIIRYNVCRDNINIGIHMNGDLSQGEDGIIHRPQVYGNRIYNNHAAAGINLDGVDSARIYNNLIYNNTTAQGIVLFQGDGAIVSKNAWIANNTIVVPSTGRWGILLLPGAESGTVILNNIIHSFHSFRGVLGVGGTSGLISDYNVLQENRLGLDTDNSTVSMAVWQAQGLDQHSLLATSHSSFFALFASNDTTDLHLAANSIARDAGTDQVSGLVMTDFDGNFRPSGSAYDMGAYEFQTALAVKDIQGFEAKQLGKRVLLEWTHRAENEADWIAVEYSRDGISFLPLTGILTASKNTRQSVFDTNPVVGMNYYRLAFSAEDTQTAYSKIIAIDFSNHQLEFYPNPVNGKIYFEDKGSPKNMAIYSLSGELVAKEVGVLGEVDIDVPPGYYIIVLVSKDSFLKKILLVR